MREFFKIVFAIIAPLILLGGLMFYLILSKFVDSSQPTHKEYKLTSSDSTSNLYIKTENWGITDDSQLTIITTDDDEEFKIDSAKQIVFKGLEPFLYKQNNDTLILYVWNRVFIPKDFKSSWTILQIEVDNRKMIDLRTNNKYKRV